MDRRAFFAAAIFVAACGGSKLGGGGATAGTIGTGQAGAVGTGGDGAGGDATGGSGAAGTIDTGGTAGAAIGGRGGAAAIGGRGGSFSVAGDAGSAGPCPWTPPDAPDGGFSPPPPDAGQATDGKPACSYKSCSFFGAPVSVPFDDASLGFTATDLLGKFARPATGQLIWYDGTSTTLHVQVRYDQPAVGTLRSGDPTCAEMSVDGTVVSVTTDDGRLSGDDFPGRLTASVLGEPTTMVWANLAPPHVADLHGSFRAPATWGANVQVQTLTLAVATRAETCSVCAARASTDPRFSSTSPEPGCEYDGKLFWNGMNDSTRGCTPRVTVAAWKWIQQP